MKAKLAPAIRAVCKKYGVKASLSVRNGSTLALTVQQGGIDFIENYIATDLAKPWGNKMCEATIAQIRRDNSLDVNVYWAHEHFSGVARKFLLEAIDALKGPDYFDHSDAQTDYFHRSHYIDVNIGRWNRPYALVK
jgi:hypothetical protein